MPFFLEFILVISCQIPGRTPLLKAEEEIKLANHIQVISIRTSFFQNRSPAKNLTEQPQYLVLLF